MQQDSISFLSCGFRLIASSLNSQLALGCVWIGPVSCVVYPGWATGLLTKAPGGINIPAGGTTVSLPLEIGRIRLYTTKQTTRISVVAKHNVCWWEHHSSKLLVYKSESLFCAFYYFYWTPFSFCLLPLLPQSLYLDFVCVWCLTATYFR